MRAERSWSDIEGASEMSVAQRVAVADDELRASEKQVATWIALHPVETASMSADRLADAVGVSDASVVRAARALGYAGFSDLKNALHRDLSVALATAPHRVDPRAISMRDRPDDYLAGVQRASHQLIDEMHRRLSADEIRAAAVTIARSRITHLYGIGPSSSVAEYLGLRLHRNGQPTMVARATGFRFADDLIGVAPGDSVILFAPGRFHPEMDVLLSTSADHDVPVIAVTDTLMPLLRGRVEHAFWAPFAPSGAPGETFTSMQIADILADAVASVDPARAKGTYQDLSAKREALAKRVGRPVEP
jgi:DNA-binding MurR/RpiR family transcriptional regulator